MPMFARGMIAQVFLQLLGYDMSAVGNQYFGGHVFLALRRHGINGGVEILDRNAGDGLVAQMFRQPGEMFIKRFHIFFLEQVNQIHLAYHDHALVVLVQPFDQFLIVTVVHAQSLITGDDTCLGKCFGGEAVDGFGNGYIDMYGSFAVVGGFQYGFVDEAVSKTFGFLCMEFGEGDRHLD